MDRELFIPAKQVLVDAMNINWDLGHENLGFLSESFGFLPVKPPLQILPSDYLIWDEVAAELPDLCRSLSVRKRLNSMPLLRADNPDSLPDTALLRASVIISAFAHAYYYVAIEQPPAKLPDSIQIPWEDIAQRLKRREAHMSYIDMSTYNWRLRDPDCMDPMSVENLDLLVPTWGNEPERIFLASTIETQAKSTPLITAIVQAQEAVITDTPYQLEQSLSIMIECLNQLSQICVPKVSPSRNSPFFVEAVTWAKTFAPLSVPIRKGAAGPVGAATASFQALDAFFERKKYEGGVAHESILVREWFPQHWRNFYDATRKISIPDYIRQKSNPSLNKLIHEALDAFAGENGYLGRHRLKVYGYMETAFKSGRPATAAFEGSFKNRVWENINEELKLAQQERYNDLTPTNHIYYAHITKITPLTQQQNVFKVDLVFDNDDVRYQAGDRCAILPENSDKLVQKTLVLLQASGDELIALDKTWRAAIQYRHGYQDNTHLTLSLLLKFGQLRPLTRKVIQYLLKLIPHETLQNILSTHTEHNWELWELLDVLIKQQALIPQSLIMNASKDGYDICQVIPPELFRFYSISSCGKRNIPSRHLQLTIGVLRYPSTHSQQTRQEICQGVASSFLTAYPKGKITTQIIPSPYFRLPLDHHRPIVMFAAGTGISPFIGMLKERITSQAEGDNWLFFSVRTPEDFYYQQELMRWVADKMLKLTMVFTRADTRQHIDDAIQQTENATKLRELLSSTKQEDKQAYFYVCGQTGFAITVKKAIENLLETSAPALSDKQDFARKHLEYLMATGHYRQETFTPFTQTPASEKASDYYSISDIVLHNHDEQGHWFIINEIVYDISTYGHEHPGGFKILRAYSGMDATAAYQRIGHHKNPEIQAMLTAYRIGIVRPLPHMKNTPNLQVLYQHWVKYLYLIVEIENALFNDFSFQNEAATAGESSTHLTISPAKLMFHIKSHQRFLTELLPQLIGEILVELWQRTATPDKDSTNPDLSALLIASQKSKSAEIASTLHETLLNQLKQHINNDTEHDLFVLQDLRTRCILMECEDHDFILQIKLIMRRIIQRFERLSGRDKEYGLMTSADCLNIHDALQFYFDRLMSIQNNRHSLLIQKLRTLHPESER